MELITRPYPTPQYSELPFLQLEVTGLSTIAYLMADKPQDLLGFRASLVKAIRDVDAILATASSSLPANPPAVN